MVEPLFSFRFIVYLVVGFCCLVLMAVSVSAWRRHAQPPIGSQRSKALFASPDAIPASVLSELDLIMVLGGGAPEAWNRPPSYVRQRCDDAARVVERMKEHLRRQRQPKRVAKTTINSIDILSLSAGTAHVPQLLSTDGLPIWESTASAAYLETQHGLSSKVETTSYDTIGNAFFARVGHTDLMENWKNLLIVTNEFHMERSKAIFEWIYRLGDQKRYNLYFLESPNVGLSAEALEARRQRESKSLQSVHALSQKYQTLPAVYRWLSTEHDLYTGGRLVQRAAGGKNNHGETSEQLKKSYGG